MIKTEMRNTHTTHIDSMTTEEMMRVMQNENINAARAVESQLREIAKAVDAISERMKSGGRLFYVGCGTSGRLGVLDAAECPPTYGVSPDTVVGIISGGDAAIRRAAEGAEDNYEAGCADLSAYNLTSYDSVVGISVAGGAKYVLGALALARGVGALTVALTCNDGCPIEQGVDIRIHPDTGAEVITGSTRMKAGTAHKMILNMISTGVMIKQGYVYENLMINLRPSNMKLRSRMIRIVRDIIPVSCAEAEKLLEESDFVIREAVAKYKLRKAEI